MKLPNRQEYLDVKDSNGIMLSLDNDNGLVYVRLRNGKIDKTREVFSGNKSGCMMNIDFDAGGTVLGVEIIKT